MNRWPCIDPSIKEQAAYVFVDVETFGLDYQCDPVVELGIRVTDKYLKDVTRKTWLILPEDLEDAWRSSSDFIKEMHTKSGLIDDLRVLPKEGYTIDDVDHPDYGRYANYSANFQSYDAWRWLTESLDLEPGKMPMCGSSVHFDRSMIESQLLVLHGFFSHRNIDVSTVKELCRRWNPALYSRISKDPMCQKENQKHRPQEDLDGTIHELQFYFDNFFQVEMNDEAEGQFQLPVTL